MARVIENTADLPFECVFVSPDGRTIYTRNNTDDIFTVGRKHCQCEGCSFEVTLYDDDDQPDTFQVDPSVCPVLIWVQSAAEMPKGVYRKRGTGDVLYPDEKGDLQCLENANLEFLCGAEEGAIAVEDPCKEVVVPVRGRYYRFPFNWVPVKAE